MVGVLFHVEHFGNWGRIGKCSTWNKAEYRPDRAPAHNGKAPNPSKFLTQNHGSFPPLEGFSGPGELVGGS